MSEERATVESFMKLIDEVKSYGFSYTDRPNIEAFATRLATQAQAPESGLSDTKTGYPPSELMQDDCRGLSKALAGRPDARLHAREAAAAIALDETAEPQPSQGEDAPAARGEVVAWVSLEDRLRRYGQQLAVCNEAADALAQQATEIEELDALRDKLAGVLSRTAVALRGPEPPLTRWSWHDLPERAAAAIAAPPAIEPAQGAAEGEALRKLLQRADEMLYEIGGSSEGESRRIAAAEGLQAEIRQALTAQPQATAPTSAETKP